MELIYGFKKTKKYLNNEYSLKANEILTYVDFNLDFKSLISNEKNKQNNDFVICVILFLIFLVFLIDLVCFSLSLMSFAGKWIEFFFFSLLYMYFTSLMHDMDCNELLLTPRLFFFNLLNVLIHISRVFIVNKKFYFVLLIKLLSKITFVFSSKRHVPVNKSFVVSFHCFCFSSMSNVVCQ